MAKRGWGFDTRYIDDSVRPQDDFYHYAVGNWLKNNAIPPHESSWGSFLILRYNTDRQLKTLLEEVARKTRAKKGSPEQMIRDLYRSGMDEKTRNALGMKPLLPLRSKIRALKDRADIVPLLADLHATGLDGFWDTDVDQDMKEATRYVLYFSQGGLGMPDRDYYLKDEPEQKRVREAYVAHIKKLAALTGLSAADADRMTDVVMRLETKLAKASMKKEDFREPEKIYHKYSLSKLKKEAPFIDWKTYFARSGADIRDLIVTHPPFVKEIDRMLSKEPLEDLKTYLEWHLMNGMAGMLGSRFVKEQFWFYGTVLSGVTKMKPRWRRVLGAVNGCVGELLGQLYVKRYFGAEAKERVEGIVDDLVAAYASRIKELEWMGPTTKKRALKKLHALHRKLGYPKKWKSYRGLLIKPDDYAGNLLRASARQHKRMMAKLGKPIDREEWFMFPQTVNAYFAPTLNDIVFPAAILQHPFFSLSADDAVNYGAMGSVIGHEMTHGFDSMGAKFDENGNLKNWWHPADKKRFEAKGRLVKNQYDKYVVAGLNVNGKLTVTENIADIGGLCIAFDAYQRHLKAHGRKDIDGFTPEQRFFLGYAQTEHELRRPEAQRLSILTDEHSPSICRVNGPLSNMTGFYDAFGVKKGDKLYRAPSQRAEIW